jgi:predicted NAD/FAD-dependent oxidoreductase
MNTKIKPDPIIIIGAGMSGLTAAWLLNEEQLPVLVLDKSRGVGGRMATRRFGGGRFDHGAQYFTVRDERFGRLVVDWQANGVVSEWARGFADAYGTLPAYSHPRYQAIDGMTAVPKHLAQRLDVRLQTPVVRVSQEGKVWLVHTQSGERFRGCGLLLTPPVPQSLRLLESGDVSLPDEVRLGLQKVEYNPCLAVMAIFSGPSKLPEPGGLRFLEGPIAWMADNYRKGISPGAYAITIHASPEYSRRHWQTDEKAIVEELRDTAGPWLHQELVAWQLHRWRYSQPTTTYPEPLIYLPGPPVLVFAGDAFGGPRVEGAVISGYEAAAALISDPY